eukprot:CAMPEP_0204318924 /NCGR_PEP_ID=MMETSP0469-20131031/6805_1 /ASSEMBLY_ACC=CAM_ASM_000384 /TAXON_ID=2969 /ORGANISM="Oxyrrhis marina" /LENGTH=526 /DNA_ID=CAMNT_0051300033 /DNA_START=25 /DNA_END=1605 /DNA_ORIENTATION=-
MARPNRGLEVNGLGTRQQGRPDRRGLSLASAAQLSVRADETRGPSPVHEELPRKHENFRDAFTVLEQDTFHAPVAGDKGRGVGFSSAREAKSPRPEDAVLISARTASRCSVADCEEPDPEDSTREVEQLRRKVSQLKAWSQKQQDTIASLSTLLVSRDTNRLDEGIIAELQRASSEREAALMQTLAETEARHCAALAESTARETALRDLSGAESATCEGLRAQVASLSGTIGKLTAANSQCELRLQREEYHHDKELSAMRDRFVAELAAARDDKAASTQQGIEVGNNPVHADAGAEMAALRSEVSEAEAALSAAHTALRHAESQNAVLEHQAVARRLVADARTLAQLACCDKAVKEAAELRAALTAAEDRARSRPVPSASLKPLAAEAPGGQDIVLREGPSLSSRVVGRLGSRCQLELGDKEVVDGASGPVERVLVLAPIRGWASVSAVEASRASGKVEQIVLREGPGLSTRVLGRLPGSSSIQLSKQSQVVMNSGVAVERVLVLEPCWGWASRSALQSATVSVFE